jgi:hypothetical protein
MRIFVRFTVVTAFILSGQGVAQAQADIGLVNLVAGDVAFVPQAGQAGKVKAFMKVREGDRFEIPAGGQLRVVYFDGSRQERWKGPAVFRAAKEQGSRISGAPAEVSVLPSGVPQRIARVPELLQNAKLGGVQVRGGGAARAGPKESLPEARAAYDKLRQELPADDITAELYLYSALNDHQLYDEMAGLVAEMQRKQPASDEVKSLAAWLEKRRGR